MDTQLEEVEQEEEEGGDDDSESCSQEQCGQEGLRLHKLEMMALRECRFRLSRC